MNNEDIELSLYLERLRAKWRLLRFRAGYSSARQADEAMGVTPGLVARVESSTLETDPRAGTLIRLARAYGVNPGEMLAAELPPGAFDHLGEGWTDWIAANVNTVRQAWMLDLMEKRPDMFDEEGAVENFVPPDDMVILAWAADPANLNKLKYVRILQQFRAKEIGVDELRERLPRFGDDPDDVDDPGEGE